MRVMLRGTSIGAKQKRVAHREGPKDERHKEEVDDLVPLVAVVAAAHMCCTSAPDVTNFRCRKQSISEQQTCAQLRELSAKRRQSRGRIVSRLP